MMAERTGKDMAHEPVWRLWLTVAALLTLLPAAAQAQARLCVVNSGSWSSGNFPGVADCRAGDAVAVLLPAQYPLAVAIGRFCDMSRPVVVTERLTDSNNQPINSFVCTYAGTVRSVPGDR